MALKGVYIPDDLYREQLSLNTSPSRPLVYYIQDPDTILVVKGDVTWEKIELLHMLSLEKECIITFKEMVVLVL